MKMAEITKIRIYLFLIFSRHFVFSPREKIYRNILYGCIPDGILRMSPVFQDPIFVATFPKAYAG